MLLPVLRGGPSIPELILAVAAAGVFSQVWRRWWWGPRARAEVQMERVSSWYLLLPWIVLSAPGSVCPAVQTQLLLTL